VPNHKGVLGTALGRNRPVFVDDTGWRRWWFRGGGLVACALCAAYLGMVVFGLTGRGPLSGLRLPLLAPQHHGAAPGHGGSTGDPTAAGAQTANGAHTVSAVDPAATTTTTQPPTTSTTTASVGQGRAPTATTIPADPPSSPTTVAGPTHGNNGGNGKGKGTPPSDPGKSNDAPGHTTHGQAAH
jgi:hypothetical protein